MIDMTKDRSPLIMPSETGVGNFLPSQIGLEQHHALLPDSRRAEPLYRVTVWLPYNAVPTINSSNPQSLFSCLMSIIVCFSMSYKASRVLESV